MAAKLNTYEKQALASIGLAALASVVFLGQAFLILQRFNFSEFEVGMRSGGMRHLAIMGASALGILAGITALLFGINSAGQTRNKKSNLSWMGFFVSAIVTTLTLVMFFLFFFAKDLISVK